MKAIKKVMLMLCALLVVSACSYDDEEIWSKVNDHEARISALEDCQKQVNNNITALQELLNTQDYITKVSPLVENGVEVGYTIEFAKSEPITLYHGKKGESGDAGNTPVISLTKEKDGNWYWTLNGELMKDEKGNPIRANGLDGKDGEDGKDGADGEDGKDGHNGSTGATGPAGRPAPTPQVSLGSKLSVDANIENEEAIDASAVYLSVDGGSTWYRISGEKGETGSSGSTGATGDSMIESIEDVTGNYVEITLHDGNSFKIAYYREFKIGKDASNEAIHVKSSPTTLDLKFPDGLNANDVTGLIAEVIVAKNGTSDFSTRANDCPVSVEVINAESVIINAQLKISYNPKDIQTGDEYMIRATLIYKDGSTIVTARALTFTAPPKIGDIYYSDGSYSTKLIDGKTPIGVIFYLTAEDEDNRLVNTAEAEALGRTPTGLVLALKNATWAENEYINNKTTLMEKIPTWEDFPVKKSSTNFCWNSFLADAGKTPNGKDGWIERKYDEDIPNLVFDDNAMTSCYNNFSGLKNCQIIATSGKLGDLKNYPAFYAAKLYNDNNPRPEGTTEWFLPSSGQWIEVIHGLGGVNIEKNLGNFKVLKNNHISLSTSDEGANPDPRPEDFTKGCVIKSINSYLEKVGSGKYTAFNTEGSGSNRYDQQFWTSTEATAYEISNEEAVYIKMSTYNSTYDIYISAVDKNYYNGTGGGSCSPRPVRCILAF